MYLWCSRCYHAAPETSWSVKTYKYGVCPRCGVSEYKNAVKWEMIAIANDYPLHPIMGTRYPPQPELF